MKAEIKAEHERLHDIVFEGAANWVTHAAMQEYGLWVCIGPLSSQTVWTMVAHDCVNQPETTLDWRDTLIRRKQ